LTKATFEDAEALVEQLRSMIGTLRGDAQRAARRVSELESDARELQDALQASERQGTQLANLYVATYQLHASLALEDVCKAICEIAINLLGAERYALLLRDDDRHRVDVVARSAEVDEPFSADEYIGGDRMVEEALQGGRIRLGPAEDSTAVAVVPLSAEGQQLGVLVIMKLLPQKSGLGVDDRELIDVLAAHAASALLAARLFHERTRKLRTLEGLMQLLRPGEAG